MRKYFPFLAILLCGVVLGATRATEALDLRLLDAQFKLLRAWFPQPVEREVAVIGIDEDTAKAFPEPIALWHAHFNRLFRAMVVAQPAALGLDIILPDRSFESVLAGSDMMMMKGLLEGRRSYPLVIGLTLDPQGKPRPIHPPFLSVAGADGNGYVLFRVDPDGVVRRYDEHLADDGHAIVTLSGRMARRMKIEPGEGLIDYWRGAPFNYVPLHQVLQWFEAGDEKSLTGAFRGRPVLVGIVFKLEDRQLAPVQLAGWEPDASNNAGVLLHAQTLRTMLNAGFVQNASVVGIALVAALLAGLWFVTIGTTAVLLALGAVFLVLVAGSTLLLAGGTFFPIVAPALTAVLALGGRNGYETLLKLRERRRLRASFGGYVSPSVMDEILAGRIHPDLAGANQEVCILFSDIRGYTTRSERMTPEQVIRFLNRYFESVVALVHERGGAVVSFMGDGIMAVFGAPKPLENPSREAFDTACAMLKYVAELNRQFQTEGEAPIEIGIGLHFGEAVLGHVGSASRHDYTAIGDVTNVASRLESLTKEAGYRVVVSRVVAEHLGRDHGLASLGPMAIKGHSPVEVYGHDKT